MKTIMTIIAVLTLSLCSLVAAEINVGDLNPKNVIGRLGKSLGTRMTIAGRLAEGVLMVNPLKLSEINGQPVTSNVVIEIRSNLNIEQGVDYRFEGYESGAFEGGAQVGFHFRSFFVVIAGMKSSTNPHLPPIRPGEVPRQPTPSTPTPGDYEPSK